MMYSRSFVVSPFVVSQFIVLFSKQFSVFSRFVFSFSGLFAFIRVIRSSVFRLSFLFFAFSFTRFFVFSFVRRFVLRLFAVSFFVLRSLVVS